MQETANVTQVNARSFFQTASTFQGTSSIFGEVLGALVARVDSAGTARFELRPAGPPDGTSNESDMTLSFKPVEDKRAPYVRQPSFGAEARVAKADARQPAKPAPQAQRPGEAPVPGETGRPAGQGPPEAGQQTGEISDDGPPCGPGDEPAEEEAEPQSAMSVMPEAVLTPLEAIATVAVQAVETGQADAADQSGGGQTPQPAGSAAWQEPAGAGAANQSFLFLSAFRQNAHQAEARPQGAPQGVTVPQGAQNIAAPQTVPQAGTVTQGAQFLDAALSAPQAGAPLSAHPETAQSASMTAPEAPADQQGRPAAVLLEQGTAAPQISASAEQPLVEAADKVIAASAAPAAAEAPESGVADSGAAAADADSTELNQGIATLDDVRLVRAAETASAVTDEAVRAQEDAGSSVAPPQDGTHVKAQGPQTQEPQAQLPQAPELQAQVPQASEPQAQEPQAQEPQAAEQKAAEAAPAAMPNSAGQAADTTGQAATGPKHAVNAHNYAAVSSEPQAPGGFNAIPVDKPAVYAVSFDGEGNRTPQMQAQFQGLTQQFADAPEGARVAGGEADARGMFFDGRGSGRAGDGASSQARSESVERTGETAPEAGKGEFAQRLSGARGVPRADQVETIEKIVKSMTMAVRRGESEVRIMLQPPRLGSVRVELVVRNGALTASFETQTQAARHVISSNLPHLKAALESQGIEVEGFNVSVEREAGQSTFTDGRESSERFPGGGAFVSEAEEEETYDLFEEKRRMTAGTSLVDYFV